MFGFSSSNYTKGQGISQEPIISGCNYGDQDSSYFSNFGSTGHNWNRRHPQKEF